MALLSLKNKLNDIEFFLVKVCLEIRIQGTSLLIVATFHCEGLCLHGVQYLGNVIPWARYFAYNYLFGKSAELFMKCNYEKANSV